MTNEENAEEDNCSPFGLGKVGLCMNNENKKRSRKRRYGLFLCFKDFS